MVSETAHRYRVLVVDDEHGPRASLCTLLKRDFDVVCADSVDMCLAMMKETPVDVVVLDIQMPLKDGFDGLLEIRRFDPLVSIIMMTAYGTHHTPAQAVKLGANDYLNKPFDIPSVLAAIQRNSLRTRYHRKLAKTDAGLHGPAGRSADDLRHGGEAVGICPTQHVGTATEGPTDP